jgi:hypothetical protein
VVVEKPWLEAVKQLPPPVDRHRYGTWCILFAIQAVANLSYIDNRYHQQRLGQLFKRILRIQRCMLATLESGKK